MVKLFVDSRRRTRGTDTDFSFQPPETIALTQQRCHVDTVLLPNTMYTLRAGENVSLYVREDLDDGINPLVTTYRVVELPQGQYDATTLAVAVADALNTGTTLGAGTYFVLFNETTGKLDVTTTAANSSSFTIFPEELLTTSLDAVWNSNVGPALQRTVQTLNSANRVCGFLGLSVIAADAAGSPASGDSVVNVLPFNQVFIHANFGVPGDSIGPNGEDTIVRRVVCSAPQNGLIIDRFSTSWDFVKVSTRNLSELSFRITDVNGRVISTNGHPVSFSVIFE